MRIEKTALDAQNRCVYSLYKEKGCIGHAVGRQQRIGVGRGLGLDIQPDHPAIFPGNAA